MSKITMRTLLHWLLALSCTIGTLAFAQQQAQPAPPAPQAQGRAEHLLGSGDTIRVNVFQSPDLSLETRISEQGQISFPLAGAVTVGGLSVSAAEQRIAKALRDGKFVLNPQVNILVMQIRSAQVSVLGQVGKPGRYPIEQAGSKVSEMVAAAGGVNPTASDVVTLVGTRNGRQVKLDIDLPAILQSGRAELDVQLENGDIIYVKESVF